MSMKRDLAQLARLTDAAFQAAQGDMAAAKAREVSLRETLKSLDLSRSQRATATLGETDVALIAGADVQWVAWVEQRRRLINAELAQCLVKQDHCQQVVRRTFGRDQAVTSLEKARAAIAKRDAARKSDYTS